MKPLSRPGLAFALALLALSTIIYQPSTVLAQGTAFTYQGQLQSGGIPASGTYDLKFTLYTSDTEGTAIAGPVTNNAVAITNGLFTVLIDFNSNPFTGATNWLQIGVESNGVSGFTALTPRQQLTPTPYAIYSEGASNLLGTVPVAQLSGTLGLGQLPSAVVTNNETSVTLSSVTLTGTLNLPSAGTINAGNNSLLYADGADDFYAGPGAGSVANSASDSTGIGYGSLSSNSNGVNNTAIGYQSLNNNTNGSFNVASGGRALFSNTSGSDNAAYGRRALYANTSGSDNTADGYEALTANPDGSGNVAVGSGALQNCTNDSGLVAIGFQALLNDSAGDFYYGYSKNIAVGYQALREDTVGFQNTAIGFQALYENTSGYNNTANGPYALYYNTNGDDNTANGFEALEFNTSGSDNTANGFGALEFNTSGSDNTANGVDALFDNGGNYNTGDGAGALYSNTNGSYNTANGVDALYYNTNGDDNTANGFGALYYNTSGSDNTANGVDALFDNGGNYNTADGGGALYDNFSGNNNTAIGENALGALGYETYRGGTNNIALGCNTGSGLQGNESDDIDIGNVGIGGESGITRIGTTGQQTFTYLAGNVALDNTLNVDQYGNNNGNVLSNALVFGTGVPFSGEGIASKRTSGGTQYDLEFCTDYDNRMIILNDGDVGIGNSSPANLLVVGTGGAYCNGTTWVNGSDRNSKKDFAAIKPGEVLQKVSAMPITEWQYKIDPAGIKHIGPMAQDFYAAFGLNGADDKHISTVDEGGVALAAIQGLNEKVDEKDAEIQKLEQQNDSLGERLNELASAVKSLEEKNGHTQ